MKVRETVWARFIALTAVLAFAASCTTARDLCKFSDVLHMYIHMYVLHMCMEIVQVAACPADEQAFIPLPGWNHNLDLLILANVWKSKLPKSRCLWGRTRSEGSGVMPFGLISYLRMFSTRLESCLQVVG